jgi:two-component system cell cycle response regulator
MCARILIVDDDPTNVDLLRMLVSAFGHEPLTALSGEEALAIMAGIVPDLVLCDVHMPGMDGFEVLRRCRGDARLGDVRIVAVTALAMVGDRERLLAAGFDEYMSKPIEPETFVDDLRRFLPAGERQPERLPYVERGAASRAAPPVSRRGNGYVLVIDDSQADRVLMQHLLESCGFEVFAADGAGAAIRAADARMPALVICDVHMPHVDGYELLVRLRERPGGREIPFVFLSSSAAAVDMQHGLRLGAVRFLVRPIEPEVLLKELEPFLEAI